MTWLVTGATGRIGSAFLERVAGDVALLLLVRGDVEAERARVARVAGPRTAAALAAGRVELLTGDLERRLPDAAFLARRGVRGLLHLAAHTRFESDGEATHARVNVDGAMAMARLAAALGVPLFHVSTAFVSGDHDGPFLEDQVDVGQRPRNVYEATKLAAESALRLYRRRCDFPLVVFRPGVVLPRQPRAADRGRPPAAGPLVHLRLLARLQGRAGGVARELRHPGLPSALLSIVDLDTVTAVLAQAVRSPGDVAGTYHVVDRQPIEVGRLCELVNEQLSGLRARLTGGDRIEDPDRWERLALDRLGVYVPYLFGRTHHDRTRLERDFDLPDGLDEEALRTLFERHARAFRTASNPARSSSAPAAARSVRDYFEGFLLLRRGRRLVPGLESLSESFSVSITGVGRYRIVVERGVLVEVLPATTPGPSFDYETDAESFGLAIAALRRPADLFFEQRVRIRGDLHRALRTAAALEEFFRLHPYAAARSA